MPNYRRLCVPGGTWFFTVNLLERHGNDLLVRKIDLLRDCVARERNRRPFAIVAWVVLPEHMHWIWRLPEGDADFATRWRRIKTDSVSALKRPSAARTPGADAANAGSGNVATGSMRSAATAICTHTSTTSTTTRSSMVLSTSHRNGRILPIVTARNRRRAEPVVSSWILKMDSHAKAMRGAEPTSGLSSDLTTLQDPTGSAR